MAVKLTASREELEARVRAAEEVVAADVPAAGRSSCRAVVQALIDQGDAYREMRQNDDAVGCYERALTRLSDAPDGPDSRDLRALAQADRAVALVRLKRADDAMAASTQALATVADGSTALLRRSRALALAARAAALAALGRPAEAQQVAEEVICEFADDPIQGPKGANVVAGGRFTRAFMLLEQEQVEPAQAALADLIAEYGDDEAPSVMLLMAKARLHQARALQRLDEIETAAGIRLELTEQYGACEDRQFREVGVIAGIHHGSALIGAGRASEAVAVAELLRGLMSARPLRENPGLELIVLLMLARAQLRSSDPEAAASTVRAALGRDDLVAVARGHTQRVGALIAAILPDLARAAEDHLALELVEAGLRQLRSRTPDPEHLAGLWLYRPQLIRDTGGSLDAVIAACDEVIGALGGCRGGRARAAIVNAWREKSLALGRKGRLRDAVAICDRVIADYDRDEDSFTRLLVADVMTQKANLLLKRRRGRAAVRTLNQLIAYCGDPPAEPLRKSAGLARDRIAAIRTASADRRRLRVVAFGLLALWLAVAVRRGQRAFLPSGANRRH